MICTDSLGSPICVSFFPPHIEDLSAQVKGIQSRGVGEGKVRERKIWHNPERDWLLSAVFFLKSRLNQ